MFCWYRLREKTLTFSNRCWFAALHAFTFASVILLECLSAWLGSFTDLRNASAFHLASWLMMLWREPDAGLNCLPSQFLCFVKFCCFSPTSCLSFIELTPVFPYICIGDSLPLSAFVNINRLLSKRKIQLWLKILNCIRCPFLHPSLHLTTFLTAVCCFLLLRFFCSEVDDLLAELGKLSVLKYSPVSLFLLSQVGLVYSPTIIVSDFQIRTCTCWVDLWMTVTANQTDYWE